MSELQELRAKAARARKLAVSVLDKQAGEALDLLANELEQQAAILERDQPKGRGQESKSRSGTP